jgi:hypothetical protein
VTKIGTVQRVMIDKISGKKLILADFWAWSKLDYDTELANT